MARGVDVPTPHTLDLVYERDLSTGSHEESAALDERRSKSTTGGLSRTVPGGLSLWAAALLAICLSAALDIASPEAAGSTAEVSVAMEEVRQGIFEGRIPGQPPFTTVKYFVMAVDGDSTVTDPARALETNDRFSFQVLGTKCVTDMDCGPGELCDADQTRSSTGETGKIGIILLHNISLCRRRPPSPAFQ